MSSRGLALLALAALAVWAAAPSAAAPDPLGIEVVGPHLVATATGAPVRLLGVDRSGSEYMCTNRGGRTVFDGPTDAASIDAIRSWHVNAVRIPLNEDCLVTGEFGESGCTDGYARSYMRWADAHDVSYLGWAWDATDSGWTRSGGPSLIVNYAGVPTAYGVGLEEHLGALARGRAAAGSR